MVIKQADDLHRMVVDLLVAAGASEDNAADVTDHLIRSDLSGVATHGVIQLASYIEAIRAGDLLPKARPEVLRDDDRSALITGNWTFGHATAKFATDVAIGKARAGGLSIVSIVQSHHIGRLGHYVEMAAAEGLISLVFAGGFGALEPQTVPYGSRTPLLHTNPIAMGCPMPNADPMMFDFATTALSGVKVVNANKRGEELPSGAIVDAEGRPTTDAGKFFDGGSHVPFGAHKGYALMMAVEFLGRIFSGADDFADDERGGVVMRHQGVTIIAARADLFRDMDGYLEGAAEMVRQIHGADPAPGFAEVLAPGDMESRSRAEREREGIPLHDDVWQALAETAAALGVATA